MHMSNHLVMGGLHTWGGQGEKATITPGGLLPQVANLGPTTHGTFSGGELVIKQTCQINREGYSAKFPGCSSDMAILSPKYADFNQFYLRDTWTIGIAGEKETISSGCKDSTSSA